MQKNSSEYNKYVREEEKEVCSSVQHELTKTFTERVREIANISDAELSKLFQSGLQALSSNETNLNDQESEGRLMATEFQVLDKELVQLTLKMAPHLQGSFDLFAGPPSKGGGVNSPFRASALTAAYEHKQKEKIQKLIELEKQRQSDFLVEKTILNHQNNVSQEIESSDLNIVKSDKDRGDMVQKNSTLFSATHYHLRSQAKEYDGSSVDVGSNQKLNNYKSFSSSSSSSSTTPNHRDIDPTNPQHQAEYNENSNSLYIRRLMKREDDIPHFNSEETEEFEKIRQQLHLMIKELTKPGAENIFIPIMNAYRRVVLSEYYIVAMRSILNHTLASDTRTLNMMSKINSYAVECVEELVDHLQVAEREQLEKIRRICVVALEDMEKLPDLVNEMKPFLDRDFVAYLGYAIDKERALLQSQHNRDPDKYPSQWLQVLAVIRQGVYAELAKDIRKEIEAIMYVLRMPTPKLQRDLLNVTIQHLPTWDVRQFHKVASNIIDHFKLRGPVGDIDPNLVKRVEQFGHDLKELLPPELLNLKAAPADRARGLLPSSYSQEQANLRLKEGNSKNMNPEIEQAQNSAYRLGATPAFLDVPPPSIQSLDLLPNRPLNHYHLGQSSGSPLELSDKENAVLEAQKSTFAAAKRKLINKKMALFDPYHFKDKEVSS